MKETALKATETDPNVIIPEGSGFSFVAKVGYCGGYYYWQTCWWCWQGCWCCWWCWLRQNAKAANDPPSPA